MNFIIKFELAHGTTLSPQNYSLSLAALKKSKKQKSSLQVKPLFVIGDCIKTIYRLLIIK